MNAIVAAGGSMAMKRREADMPKVLSPTREHARAVWDAAVAAADPFELVRTALAGARTESSRRERGSHRDRRRRQGGCGDGGRRRSGVGRSHRPRDRRGQRARRRASGLCGRFASCRPSRRRQSTDGGRRRRRSGHAGFDKDGRAGRPRLVSVVRRRLRSAAGPCGRRVAQG